MQQVDVKKLSGCRTMELDLDWLKGERRNVAQMHLERSTFLFHCYQSSSTEASKLVRPEHAAGDAQHTRRVTFMGELPAMLTRHYAIDVTMSLSNTKPHLTPWKSRKHGLLHRRLCGMAELTIISAMERLALAADGPYIVQVLQVELTSNLETACISWATGLDLLFRSTPQDETWEDIIIVLVFWRKK